MGAVPLLLIVGPTATGKSQAAIQIAKEFNGEIISADSMQIYKNMDIGTAKPGKRERRAVRHYLIDDLEPSKRYSAAQFRRRALQALQKIRKKGKLPIVAGGSGLYIQSLIEGFSKHPAGKASIRKHLMGLWQKKGLPPLVQKLKKIDPLLVQTLDLKNPRRVLRALEIYEVTGKPPSFWYQAKQPITELGFQPLCIGLTLPRAILYERINARVEKMFRRGLVQEVFKLSKKRLSQTAFQALGYKEFFTYPGSLKNLSRTQIKEIKETIQRQTRRFAKRQITWFKKQPGIYWIAVGDKETPKKIHDCIKHYLLSQGLEIKK